MPAKDKDFIPALRFEWLTPAYDFVVSKLVQEKRFKQQLIRQAQIRPGQRILDVGCGTGTLALWIKKSHPGADVIGLDGDSTVLNTASQKAGKVGVPIKLIKGLSTNLPFDDGEFDHVFSSLLFHHLTTENKKRTLHEIARVLRPSGTFHLADFGKAHNLLMKAAFTAVRLLDGFEPTEDHALGLIPSWVRECEFKMIRRTMRLATLAGTLEVYEIRKNVHEL